MSQPTRSQVHVDAILTQMSVAYIQSSDEFIADKVFPNVPVGKQSDKYFKYNKDAFLRAQAERRSGATESAGGGFELSTDNYFCDQFSFHKDVPKLSATQRNLLHAQCLSNAKLILLIHISKQAFGQRI